MMSPKKVNDQVSSVGGIANHFDRTPKYYKMNGGATASISGGQSPFVGGGTGDQPNKKIEKEKDQKVGNNNVNMNKDIIHL